MGTDKNIKLHIVTDIKVLYNSYTAITVLTCCTEIKMLEIKAQK